MKRGQVNVPFYLLTTAWFAVHMMRCRFVQ